MEETKKRYNRTLVVVDLFSKFVWLYPSKSTGAEEVIDRFHRQSAIFGNSERIISNRGTAFTSNFSTSIVWSVMYVVTVQQCIHNTPPRSTVVLI